MVGMCLVYSGTTNGLDPGVELTRSCSSSGNGGIVAGGVSTPPLPCNEMDDLVMPGYRRGGCQ